MLLLCVVVLLPDDTAGVLWRGAVVVADFVATGAVVVRCCAACLGCVVTRCCTAGLCVVVLCCVAVRGWVNTLCCVAALFVVLEAAFLSRVFVV